MHLRIVFASGWSPALPVHMHGLIWARVSLPAYVWTLLDTNGSSGFKGAVSTPSPVAMHARFESFWRHQIHKDVRWQHCSVGASSSGCWRAADDFALGLRGLYVFSGLTKDNGVTWVRADWDRPLNEREKEYMAPSIDAHCTAVDNFLVNGRNAITTITIARSQTASHLCC